MNGSIQLALFEHGPRVLVDDALGRIAYHPEVVDAALAAQWFEQLRDSIEWNAQRRQMYDREVDVPRLTAHFRLGKDTPPLLLAAATRVCGLCNTNFNSVGLNLYRNGRDSVAPHNDHLCEIVSGEPIALLSLGATRQMVIRAKESPRRLLHIELEAGSVLLMSHAVQRHYDHGIPKVKSAVGARISLAFRVKPEAAPKGARYG